MQRWQSGIGVNEAGAHNQPLNGSEYQPADMIISWRRTRCRVPMIAAVISEGGYRFARARSVLERAGFSVVHMPAVFDNTPEGSSCKGFNGLRLAMRNAWRMILATNTSMAVFEDDVVLHADLPGSERPTESERRYALKMAVCRFLSDSVENNADLGYFGFLHTRHVRWGTHAIWTTPKAAKLLLKDTAKCYRRVNDGTDNNVVKACRGTSDSSRPRLRCVYALVPGQSLLKMGGRHGFYGLFVQDRVNISAYLHTKENVPRDLTQVLPKSVWRRDANAEHAR